jgi:hypothetical protein
LQIATANLKGFDCVRDLVKLKPAIIGSKHVLPLNTLSLTTLVASYELVLFQGCMDSCSVDSQSPRPNFYCPICDCYFV